MEAGFLGPSGKERTWVYCSCLCLLCSVPQRTRGAFWRSQGVAGVPAGEQEGTSPFVSLYALLPTSPTQRGLSGSNGRKRSESLMPRRLGGQ